MRWIVGDIHGCARELEALLGAIRYDPSRDELWTTGDLVNTGADSPAVLRLWRDAGGRGVLGNHDAYALLVRSGGWPRRPDRLAELFDAPDADELLAILRGLPLLVHLPAPDGGPDAWLVHAGLHPRWRDPAQVARRSGPPWSDASLAGDDVRFAITARCCTADGALVEHVGAPAACPHPSRPWDDYYDGDTLVVHGHWAMRGHYRGRRTLGLDSGCVYGGPLTAWCQDEDRIVQVRA